MRALKPGDIIFNTDFMHCYICISPCLLIEINKSICAAHASPATDENAVIQSSLPSNQYFIFRCQNAELAEQAAAVAKQYAPYPKPKTETDKKPLLAYNHAQLTRKNNACYAAQTLGKMFYQGSTTPSIRPGIDALIARAEHLLDQSLATQDENGFTCAQLVILSYQIAAAQHLKLSKDDASTDQSICVKKLTQALCTHEEWTRAEQLAERLVDDKDSWQVTFACKRNQQWFAKTIKSIDDPSIIMSTMNLPAQERPVRRSQFTTLR